MFVKITKRKENWVVSVWKLLLIFLKLTLDEHLSEAYIRIFLSGYVKHPDRDIYSALALKSNVIWCSALANNFSVTHSLNKHPQLHYWWQ